MVEARRFEAPVTREEFIREQIKQDTVTLLTRGGVISNKGEVKAYTFNDVDLNLLPELEQSKVRLGLDRIGIASITLSTNDDLDLRKHKSGRTKIYFIKPGIIHDLGYKRGPYKKTDTFFIRKINDDGVAVDESISSVYQFSHALVEHARDILVNENLWSEDIKINRYFDAILREVSDEYGIGESKIQP